MNWTIASANLLSEVISCVDVAQAQFCSTPKKERVNVKRVRLYAELKEALGSG